MIKDKSKLLEQVAEFNNLQNHLAADCAAYCKDRVNSIEDRWELFCVAPDKEHDGCYDLPSGLELELDISPYDDFGLERHAVFDVCDRINQWQDFLDGKEKYGCDFVKKLDQEKVNIFKEHYMDQYMGSWEHDW